MKELIILFTCLKTTDKEKKWKRSREKERKENPFSSNVFDYVNEFDKKIEAVSFAAPLRTNEIK